MMPTATGFSALAARTPARLGIGRSGPRPRTPALLALLVARAAAADAVRTVMPPTLARRLRAVEVATAAATRDACLRDPRRAARLDAAARARLRRCRQRPDVQIVLCDGLAPAALALHGTRLATALGRRLRGRRLGTTVLVRHGRAAAAHEVGRALRPRVLCILAGQRPTPLQAAAVSAHVVAYRNARPAARPALVLRDLAGGGGRATVRALADAIDAVLDGLDGLDGPDGRDAQPARPRAGTPRRATPSRARGGRRGSRPRA